MKELADELASQYVVVYSHPDGAASRKINVGTTRGGVKVRARTEMHAKAGG